MARVVPSQVVELIDTLFSSADFEKKFCLDYSHTSQVAAIVSLVTQIPPELIALTGNSFVEFDASLATLKSSIATWQTRGNVQPLERLPGLGGLNPLALLRRALVACPDEFPSASTDDLTRYSLMVVKFLCQISLDTQDPSSYIHTAKKVLTNYKSNHSGEVLNTVFPNSYNFSGLRFSPE